MSLTSERDGPLLRLTLDRPDRGNAINLGLAAALSHALTEIDDDVRAILLRGRGRTFCVGGDVKEFAAAADPAALVADVATELHRAVYAITTCQVPVIAAVHGNVGGAGIGLVAACDIAIAARELRFRPAYVSLGLTPDAGLTWRLARHLGATRALDLLLTDATLDSDAACAAGIVSRVVDDLDAEIERVLAVVLTGPARAQSAVKRLVRAAADTSFRDQLVLEAEQISASADSPDGRAGLHAFIERRRPNFGQESE